MPSWKAVRYLAAAALGVLIAGFGGLPASAAPAEKQEGSKGQAAPEVGYRKPTDAERKAAIASIEAQLKAFRDDDYEKALKYQSTTLRRNVPTAAEFRQMMRRSYPQFAAYRSITYGEAFCDPKGDRLEIRVVVTGRDGVTVRAVYQMLREEGEYRVEGVEGGLPPRAAPQEIA